MTRLAGFLGALLVLVAGLSLGTLLFSTATVPVNAGAERVAVPGQEAAGPLEVIAEGNRYFVKVDLEDAAVEPRVGLANNDAGGYQNLAGMAQRYAGRGYAEWVVVNGDYTAPSWEANHCVPNVNCAQGLTYIDGQRRENWSEYGVTWTGRSNLGFDDDNRARIAIGDAQSKRFMTIAGGPWLVQDGGPPVCVGKHDSTRDKTRFSTGEEFDGNVEDWCINKGPHTLVGIDQEGKTLFVGITTADGATITQTAQWLKDRGAYNVIKLDSGGSTGLYHNGALVGGSASRLIPNHLAILVHPDGGGQGDTCTNNQQPKKDEVILFDEPHFGAGRCARLEVGEYSDLGEFEMDDKASSIRVGEDVDVEIFENKNFGGDHQKIESDHVNLDDNSNVRKNEASSAKVYREGSDGGNCDNPGPSQAAIFDNEDYGGACLILEVGQYPDFHDLPIDLNDMVSSIKTGSLVRLKLYEHQNYNADRSGRMSTFGAGTSDPDLTDNEIKKNAASSAKVYYPLTAPTVYEISNGDGDSSYNVTWSNVLHAERYDLYEQFDGGSWALIGEDLEAQNLQISARQPGSWCYKVKASHFGESSSESNVVCTVVNADLPTVTSTPSATPTGIPGPTTTPVPSATPTTEPTLEPPTCSLYLPAISGVGTP